MTLNIGLIGAGGMGRAHVERIENELTGGKIVAVADLNLDAAKEVAEKVGGKAYGSGEELIADPNVDAVLIATFGRVHKPDVIRAIEAGKYVLCEKPLATTAEDCREIMEAEQKAGKKLVTVGFMRRFDQSYGILKAKMDSKELGETTMVHCRHRNPTVPENYLSSMAIDDTAIHEIDTCRWLTGEEIVNVRVDIPRSTSYKFEHLTDPIVVVMYTESGIRIDDEVNVNIGYGYDIQCEAVMEQGTAYLGDQEKVYVRSSRERANAICQSHIDRFHDAFNREVQQWINAASEDRHTGSSSWDGYAATCVVDAALESLESRESKLVSVELIEQPEFYK
ncbi:Gfo/Idh/MocA family oxidoreductase [uncultured Varibaculum sp.]|uniref:Gfo/Idh/MocA family protein n=1 Tax=uncultured Varibaculum sp. TaxID=413896 RepID=UPI0027D9C5B8|nr:Gfo/Idh/MocA family oxidoreductase [uncultured Varibaculum sp.]